MTRRLHALRVGNFKAFADTQRIPIKPITLIFGPMSGTSSKMLWRLNVILRTVYPLVMTASVAMRNRYSRARGVEKLAPNHHI